MELKRCNWVNTCNEAYIKYHDNEWGIPSYDDRYLFEMLSLEMFQAGLSWEIILNKRDEFRRAFDNFDVKLVSNYSEDKIESLMNNKGIVRNRRKIISTINNARCYIKIQEEFKGFSNYIWSFTSGKIIYEQGLSKSVLSDRISKDLSMRGFKFVGSTIIYAYLQAIGIINSHDKDCFLYNKGVM